MKILLVAKPWKGGLGRYFFLAMQDMFPGQVEWITTRPETLAGRLRFRRSPETWWRELLEKIETADCDAAFFIGHRKEFRALKPRPHYVLYLVDDVRLTKGDADAFGRVFLSDPGYVAELQTAISPEQYGGVLPFACYPPLHQPLSPSAQQGDICFIGNRDTKRDPYLERLFAEGSRPLVVGNYFINSPLFWRYPLSFRPAVTNEGMGKIYARYKISLNIHARVVREGTNMRTFECAAYGIPQTVEYRPGIENYFAPGEEIMTYRDTDEMVKQIRLLLSDPVTTRKMADAARQRALAEHTYHHRIVAALGHLLPQDALQSALSNLGKSTARKAA